MMGTSPHLQGTLDLLVLRVLDDGPLHGYGISAEISRRTTGVIDIDDGALYQSLHRMAARGLIEGRWARTENNRRARFYELTSEGHDRLSNEGSAWRVFVEAVADVFEPSSAAEDTSP